MFKKQVYLVWCVLGVTMTLCGMDLPRKRHKTTISPSFLVKANDGFSITLDHSLASRSPTINSAIEQGKHELVLNEMSGAQRIQKSELQVVRALLELMAQPKFDPANDVVTTQHMIEKIYDQDITIRGCSPNLKQAADFFQLSCLHDIIRNIGYICIAQVPLELLILKKRCQDMYKLVIQYLNADKKVAAFRQQIAHQIMASKEYTVPCHEITCLYIPYSVSPDQTLYAKVEHNNLVIYQQASGQVVRQLPIQFEPKCWSRDNQFIVTPDDYEDLEQYNLIVWDIKTGMYKELDVNHEGSWTVSFSVNNDLAVVSTGTFPKVRIWQKAIGDPWQIDSEVAICSFAWSLDGTLFALGDVIGVHIWSLEHKRKEHAFIAYAIDKNGVYDVAFSPNNQFIATTPVLSDGFIKIWNQQGELLREIAVDADCLGFIWSADNQLISHKQTWDFGVFSRMRDYQYNGKELQLLQKYDETSQQMPQNIASHAQNTIACLGARDPVLFDQLQMVLKQMPDRP